MYFLGIDPSQRHTGLCLLSEDANRYVFRELKTKDCDLLTACQFLKTELHLTLAQWIGLEEMVVGFERQISRASPFLFHVQMELLEELGEWVGKSKLKLVLPMPSQLRAYMRDRHEVDITNKSTTVASFKKKVNFQNRVSSHCAEAYYLAVMAKDVYEEKWRFNRCRERPIIPWQEVGLECGTKDDN